jgi:renalase
MSYLVIGAGLCGLQIARSIHDSQLGPVTVAEKSRGVGGRIATRRTQACRFDHGAQFYSVKEPIAVLHQQWTQQKLAEPWFDAGGTLRIKSPHGLTALAKNLASGLDVRLERKAVRLESRAGLWTGLMQDGSSLSAATVILTCPLPQSLELLQTSGIAFDPSLWQIQYAKALVALIQGPKSRAGLLPTHGYLECQGGGIFSIADQHAKGLSPMPAWTVTMTAPFSQRHFDAPDSHSLQRIFEELRQVDPSFLCDQAELKKWRYSHPLNALSSGYVKAAEGLLLAGDGLAGPSLLGAMRSAKAVIAAIRAPGAIT